MTQNRPTLYCSFCGKSQHEIKKLIAGPKVYICNECVDLCKEIIDEENTTSIGKFNQFFQRPTSLQKFEKFLKEEITHTPVELEELEKEVDDILRGISA